MKIEEIAQTYLNFKNERDRQLQEIEKGIKNTSSGLARLEENKQQVNNYFNKQVSEINIPNNELDDIATDYLIANDFYRIDLLGWRHDVIGEFGRFFGKSMGTRRQLKQNPVYFKEKDKNSLLFSISPKSSEEYRYSLLSIPQEKRDYLIRGEFRKSDGSLLIVSSILVGVPSAMAGSYEYIFPLIKSTENSILGISLFIGPAFVIPFALATAQLLSQSKESKAYQSREELAIGKYNVLEKLVEVSSQPKPL